MSHERINRLELAGNRLVVSGKPLTDWLEGSNQAHYIYSKQDIQHKITQLKAQLPSAIKLHYAIKANPMQAVVDYVANMVDGLDVASVGEMHIAMASNTAACDISFAGPAKQLVELEAAVKAGITLNVESVTELQRLHDISKQQGVKANIALRVNPDFELKQSGMQMAGGSKAFGIDAELIPELLKTIDSHWLNLRGLHIYSGSQNLDAEAIITMHQQTFELAQLLLNEIEALGLATDLQHVNIGGGFGIPYFKGQKSLDISPVSDSLQALLAGRTGCFANIDIVIELGRYLVGEAGYYVCQITDIKQSRGKTFYMTNGGLHHHLSNSGNFGQVIRKNYPTLLADNVTTDNCHTVEIAGPLCTPLDIVAAKIDLPEAAIGDFVVVLQSGAYGFSASPLRFLGHSEAIERLV